MRDGPLTYPAENQGATKPVAVIIIGADGLLAARPATPIQLWHGCLALGYDLAVPATWGDELVAAECLRALGSHPTPVALMCSCPLVARAVSRVEPDVTPHLVSLVAPPVATARYVRRVHGERRVHITYAGACPSAADSAIDAWITPGELIDRFAASGVVLTEQPELFESVLPPDRRRHLSQPGGLPTSERAATIQRPRVVHEIDDDDVLGALTRQLAGDVRSLLDIAPRVGCACSGALADVPASESRAAVMQMEPPRSSRPVMADPGGLGLRRRLPIQPWILRDRPLPLPPLAPRSAHGDIPRNEGPRGGSAGGGGNSSTGTRPSGGNGHGVAMEEIDEATVAAARALHAASVARGWSSAATSVVEDSTAAPAVASAPSIPGVAPPADFSLTGVSSPSDHGATAVAAPSVPVAPASDRQTPVGNYWFDSANQTDREAPPVATRPRVADAAPAIARVARKLADTDYRGEIAAASTAVASTVRRTAEQIRPPLEARVGQLRRLAQRPGHGIVATAVVLLLLIVTLLVAADIGDDRAASSTSPADSLWAAPRDSASVGGVGTSRGSTANTTENGRERLPVMAPARDTAAGWSRSGGPAPRQSIGAPVTPPPPVDTSPAARTRPPIDRAATARSDTAAPPSARDSAAIRDSLERAAAAERARELAAIQAELNVRQARIDSIFRANGLPVPPRIAPPGAPPGKPPPGTNLPRDQSIIDAKGPRWS